MKTNYIILLMLSFIIAINIWLNIIQSDSLAKHNERIQELEYKVECLERDIITFENMHADHYSFEEDKVLELIDSTKANDYKHFLDSVKQCYNNNIK